MEGDGSHAEAGVAFVGHEDDAPAFGGEEVGAGDAGLGAEVFFPEEGAGLAGEGFGVVAGLAVGGDAFFPEGGGDLAAVLVDDGLDDVGGGVAVELDDEFAEVAFEAFDAVFFEEGIEVDFLGGHGLGLGEAGDPVVPEDAEDGLAGVLAGGGEVGVDAVAFEGGGGLPEVVAEVVEGVLLDLSGEVAEAVGALVVGEEDGLALVVSGGGSVHDGDFFRGAEGGGVSVDGLGHAGGEIRRESIRMPMEVQGGDSGGFQAEFWIREVEVLGNSGCGLWPQAVCAASCRVPRQAPCGWKPQKRTAARCVSHGKERNSDQIGFLIQNSGFQAPGEVSG